jgi:sarcosine oxidase gamma subunit
MIAQEQCRLEAINVTDCVEWHVTASFAKHGVNRGFALIENDNRIFHFAPRYLLAINHQGAAPAMAETAGAIAVDVTGKWCGYRLHGSRARDVLATGTHANLVLKGRGCAALSLFDCPVVLVRTAGADEVWVPASYAESLCHALNKMEKICD